VLPEDVQAVLPAVVSHRLVSAEEAGRVNGYDVAELLIKQVPIP
jgi:hypothetical protein